MKLKKVRLYVAFMNLWAAFDSILRDRLWLVLRELDVEKNLLDYTQRIMDKSDGERMKR